MTEHASQDPELQSFAAQLSSLTPQLSPQEQRQLLYECAYAAGSRAGGRGTIRWQVASGIMAVALLGVTLPLFMARPQRQQLAEQKLPSAPAAAHPPRPSAKPEAPGTRPAFDFALDAWQLPDTATRRPDSPLEPASQPAFSSLSVARLARTLQSP